MNKELYRELSINCRKCNTQNADVHKFCKKCGSKLHFDKSVLVKDKIFKNSLILIAVIYSLDLIILYFNHFIVGNNPFIWDISWDFIYIVFVFFFSYLNWSKLKNIFSFQKVNSNYLIGVILISIVWAIVVHYYVNLIYDFFDTSEMNKSYTDYGFSNKWTYLLYLCYTIVLVPAITEETLMRGVLYNYLKNIINEKSVIIITAFLFAITHFSLISATWIILSGIFYATLRHKTNNIWYSIIGHMTHNFVISFILVYNM